MVDQRKDKRAPASLKVKYKSATVDQFIGQLATDVSRGGLFVRTKSPLALGSLIKIELQLSDASPVIHGIGRVCWRRENPTDATLIPGMGIKFIKLEAESRAVVERIVQSRGDRPSRFDQTQGAEIAPPSIAPQPASAAPPPITAPPASAAPPPITAPPPSSAAARAQVARAPIAARVPSMAAAGSSSARAPMPLGSSSSARAPVPASASLSAPKPAASKPQTAGARSVAGLFADSPLSRSVSPDNAAESRAHSSFFPSSASSGSTASKRPAGSARPSSGRSEQARQSGQFLATAFAEGGLAADTTAQARAAAAAEADEVDELFDEVVKTSEHPAPPPLAMAAVSAAPVAAARPAQTSAERESVDDMFAELGQETGLPAATARTDQAPAPYSLSPVRATASSAPEFEEERTTERTSVEELLDGLADDAEQGVDDASPEVDQAREEEFGEGDEIGEAELALPSERPMLSMPADASAAPPDVATALQRQSSATPILIALLLVAGAAFGGFYYYKQRTAAEREAGQRQAAAENAVPPAAPEPAAAPPSSAEPQDENSAPGAAAPTQPPRAAQADAPQKAAEGSANARVDVEVSSVPRGADITVDGKRVGTTPSRVTLVVDKPTEVKVAAAGFAAMTRSLVPSADNEPLRFTLEPLPYALVVLTTPPQAQLSAGEHVSISPAPLELGHLDGGLQVSISKDGYQRMTRLVRLDEFTDRSGVMRAEIEVTLSPLPGSAAPPAQRGRSRNSRQREAPPAPSLSEPEPPAAEPAPKPVAEIEPKPAAEAAPANPKPEANQPPAAEAAPTPPAPTPPAPPTPPTPPAPL